MKYKNKTFIFVTALVLMSHVLLNNSKGSDLTEQYAEQPAVMKAVAPPFFPFLFGKTGSATGVVEVRIAVDGKVTDAHIVEFSLFKDPSWEETAKKWIFAPATDGKERMLRLTFVLRIVPKGAPWDEQTTILTFTTPYQVEVRHEVFDPPTNLDPNPIKATDLRKHNTPVESEGKT